jgi:multidrug efflux pump subunit AcrA (membrane-fusion protein)
MARTARIVLGTFSTGVLAFLGFGLSRTTVCAPTVDASTISIGVVRTGLVPHDLFGPALSSPIHNGLYVPRPAHASAHTTKGLYKLAPDGNELVRVDVKFGRASANAIEVLDGLQVGDRIVLSDMSAWDQCDRLRVR